MENDAAQPTTSPSTPPPPVAPIMIDGFKVISFFGPFFTLVSAAATKMDPAPSSAVEYLFYGSQAFAFIYIILVLYHVAFVIRKGAAPKAEEMPARMANQALIGVAAPLLVANYILHYKLFYAVIPILIVLWVLNIVVERRQAIGGWLSMGFETVCMLPQTAFRKMCHLLQPEPNKLPGPQAQRG